MSKRIAFLVATEGIEHDELTSPWGAVADAGHRPVLISTGSGDVQLFRHLDRSEKRPVDAVVDDVSIEDYNALVLPGGVANPDALRTNPAAVALVRDFVASGSPVAAICHAAWMLVEADVVVDRELASWPSLRTDIANAGGTWLDERVVTDGNLITNRNPDDLPAFNAALLEAIEHGAAQAEPA